VTEEYIRLMRAAWTTDPVTFEGKYCSIRDIHVLPKPVQRGGIPVWIGGHTGAAVRRAATIGDGWHPIGMRPPAMLGPDEYAAKVKQIHEWARRAGRDPKSIALTIRVPMEVRGKSAKAAAGDRPPFQGTADEVVADIRRYQALGVTHFVFDHTVQDLRAVLANIDRFAHDVRPKVLRAPKSTAAKKASGRK
jgi:alkanesulfonate monooxygenase SsuD/methylene tetrahydromethanopterin reductase-like flavin-dependent oxidoreductase (luciferase family)